MGLVIAPEEWAVLELDMVHSIVTSGDFVVYEAIELPFGCSVRSAQALVYDIRWGHVPQGKGSFGRFPLELYH